MPNRSNNNEVLNLIQRYSGTWSALEKYDESKAQVANKALSK